MRASIRNSVMLLAASMLLITTSVGAQQAYSREQIPEIKGSTSGKLLAAAPPSQYWLVLNLASYHKDRSIPYNETNLGLGVEKVISNYHSVGFGTYKNSFHRNTRYLSLTWNPIEYHGVKAGIAGTCFSGYADNKVLCAPLPVVSYETKHLAYEFIVTPEVVGFRMKGRFK